jgi:hypothetical protein
MIPVVVGFGIIALLTGVATIALPIIRESQGRSRRRRRRSKGRKTTRAPHQQLDIVDAPSDEQREAGR